MCGDRYSHAAFAKRVKLSRDSLGWSQEQLAEHAGVNIKTVQRCENPHLNLGPRQNTVEKLATAMVLNPKWLMYGPEPKGPNDGGPAFPTDYANLEKGLGGMSLRDYYIGQIGVGVAIGLTMVAAMNPKAEVNFDDEDAAKAAVEFTDALLKARNQGGNP